MSVGNNGMIKNLKIFLIIFVALFFIDWFLGVLRFTVRPAETVLAALNIPFGIIALRLEQTVPPMADTPRAEFLTIPIFVAMVFLQALLYTGAYLFAKKLWRRKNVRTALRHILH